MESLLVHSDLLETPVFTTLTSLLKENQVSATIHVKILYSQLCR